MMGFMDTGAPSYTIIETVFGIVGSGQNKPDVVVPKQEGMDDAAKNAAT